MSGAVAGTGTPWIAYHKPRPEARVRLYCFPHAGGGASIYRTWPGALPPQIEVLPVQLPGREARIREPAFTGLPPLIANLLPALGRGLLGGPVAFFGHSMGALIAYELARALRGAGSPRPLHLFVSARRAPDLPARTEPIHALPEPEFRQRLRELNGTPEAVLEHPELMELVGPTLRADFTLIESYEPVSAPPLDCPITAFGGVDDRDVSEEEVASWRRFTTAGFQLRMLPGDHFFLGQASGETVIREIARALLAA